MNSLSMKSDQNLSEEPIALSDKQDRDKLGEGRNYQMGFAFCKKESQGKYATIQPISPCKDYLNDVVYSELTGKPVQAYGLSCKKENIYDDKAGYAYMVIKIMQYQGGGKYPNYDKDTKNLKENYKNLEKFINHFESKKGLKQLSTITEIDENRYFIKVPLFWCQATFLISLYSLMLRIGQFWKGDNTPDEYVEKFSEFPADVYLLNAAKPKLAKILTSDVPKQDMSKFQGRTDVHNFGICAIKL